MSKLKKGKDKKKELTEKENRIVYLAKNAWIKTLREFYYPPLNEPNFVFDYTHKEGFYIDPEHKWQITMNLANTPLFKEDEEYIKYFHAISLHEVSHYQIIPYDGIMNAKLLKAAMKRVNSNFAPIVVNVFADLIIDYKLYKKYPELMSWEIRKTYESIIRNNEGKLSKFAKFLFRAYEKMWEIEISEGEENPLSELDLIVNKVNNVILKDFDDETKWEEKTTKVAYHMKSLINETFTLTNSGVGCDKGKAKRKSPGAGGGSIEVPEDVLEIMDNPLDNKNSDKLKEDNKDELRQKAEDFAKDTPYSEFGAPAGQAGILIDGNPLATWYRGLAKNLIEIKIYEEKPGGELPVYPEVWRIGNPIEELDIVQTLLNSPVIIPNVTTRKWVFKEGSGNLVEKQIPDLLIVLDSSGSMGWNYTSKKESARGEYHTALVASFAALHFAASKGVKFSIVNFSSRANICQWTNNYEEAEKVLLKYQGGGTVLPTKEIMNQCSKAERIVLVFLITDFGIYNWEGSKKSFINLTNMGHKICGFFIGSSSIPKTKFKDLLDKVSFYPINNSKDLINLVIQEIKKYYS